jgi:hypothetical protein
MRTRLSVLFSLAALASCRNAPVRELTQAQAPQPEAAPPSDSLGKTWMDMRNVDLRVLEHAVVHADYIHGEVISTKAGIVPILDTTTSFRIRITGGKVSLRGADLSVLMNEYVFNYPGSPLRDLKVETEGDHIVQSGIMHKGVDLRFKLKAKVQLMPDGKLRLHPSEVEILGVNGLKLMNALGLKLEKMLDLSGSRGASVEDNDILLDPKKIIPPPEIDGKLAAVRVEGPMLVQEFVKLDEDSVFSGSVRPDSTAPSYVFFKGGRLRFGKLTMTDTDLQILDGDPSDPLDLFLAQYQVQLIAGKSQTLPNLGLRVIFPDFSDLKSVSAETKAPRSR